MFSILRASHPARTNQADTDLTIYENGTSSVKYHKEGSEYMMTHTIPPTHPTEGPSILQPPFHYHIYQTEKFKVVEGSAHMYFGLDKKPSMTLSSRGGKDSAVLGPCRYHRFTNASSTEDLKIDIHLEPEDYANEERFFKNFFGYLNDCKRTKTSPSVFQLFVFLHSADTPLAIPVPFGMETLGVYLSRALLIVVAYFGRYGLGYQSSYPEYFDSNATTKPTLEHMVRELGHDAT